MGWQLHKEFARIFSPASGPYSAWRKAWHFYPDVAGSICVMSFSIVGCLGLIYYVNYLGPRATMYKNRYCILRDTEVKDSKLLGDIYN